MSQPKKEIEGRNFNFKQSDECSIINNPNYSKLKRMALVRSMTDRLQLTLGDIEDSVNQDRLNSLSFVPPDLLPFEINLVDGQKVTLIETDPVITLYDGELNKPEGDVIHVYLGNERELSEKFTLTKNMFTCTPETFDSVLPFVFKQLAAPKTTESKYLTMPGTSKKFDTLPNSTNEELLSSTSKKNNADQHNKNNPSANDEISKVSSKTTSDNTSPSEPEIGCYVEVEAFTHPVPKNIDQMELNDDKLATPGKKCQEQNDSLKDNYTSPFFSKIQVLGAVSTGIFSEGFHSTVKDFEKDWIQKKDITTIIFDKALGNPSDFKSVFLKTLSAIPKKKSIQVRKSSRTRKPKIRSAFKSWDELKIRLPKHSRKGRAAKGSQVKNQKITAKNSTDRNKSNNSGI